MFMMCEMSRTTRISCPQLWVTVWKMLSEVSLDSMLGVLLDHVDNGVIEPLVEVAAAEVVAELPRRLLLIEVGVLLPTDWTVLQTEMQSEGEIRKPRLKPHFSDSALHAGQAGAPHEQQSSASYQQRQ